MHFVPRYVHDKHSCNRCEINHFFGHYRMKNSPPTIQDDRTLELYIFFLLFRKEWMRVKREEERGKTGEGGKLNN